MKTLRPYQQEVLDTLRARLKETDYPLLVNASVGAGKSLIIAELLRIIEKAGWRALCLTMNSTLIRQNAETYMAQGGNAGIFCASLGMKDSCESIIFASPMSVRGSIKCNGKLSKVPFNLIIVDECHNINVNERSTSYMRIFHHYSIQAQALGHKLRFVGLTGTPYRGKGYTIVGDKLFFKEEVCAITAEWLIQENYLTQPIWGICDKSLQYDFRQLKVNSIGKFSGVELEEALHRQPRLTGKIMAEVVEIVKDRVGAFIFASSIKHCYECAEELPPFQTAIITGDTSDKLREQYINQARAGIIKYLVNVNVLCTGVDVPNFDTVVFVRPTESLVLYMQCLGRGLRLADGKTNCLILDYAGNLDRHGDIDNPIINKALKPKNNDPEYCIECFDCHTLNTLMARRCIGTTNDKRCEHWFEFKDCHGCSAKNDIVARYCRECKIELLDPNRKLNNKASNRERFIFNIHETEYLLSISNDCPIFIIKYSIIGNTGYVSKRKIHESFSLGSEKSRNFFYHTIVKKHFKEYDPIHKENWAYDLEDMEYLKDVIQNDGLYSPIQIECINKDNKQLKVVKKHFVHLQQQFS
jgi:DNA repair protein RadD